MNAGVTGIKGERALHITFDFRQGDTEHRKSCHAVATDVMAMTRRPNRIRPLVTGLFSTGANEIPGIGTVAARQEMKPRRAASVRIRRLWHL